MTSSTPPLPSTDQGARPAAVLAWHLLPALPLLAFAAATAPLLVAAGLPSIWSLLAGVLLVQVPLLLVLSRAGREPAGAARAAQAAPRGRLLVRRIGTAAATLLACLLLPGVAVGLEPLVRETAFAWLPSWWSAGLGSFGSWSGTEQAVTVVLWLLGLVLLGPIAEELYFRGRLLERVPGPPAVAALTNATLFAAYHLWQPYAFVTVLLFALPLAVARRVLGASVATCAAVHCSVNALMFTGLLAGLLAR